MQESMGYVPRNATEYSNRAHVFYLLKTNEAVLKRSSMDQCGQTTQAMYCVTVRWQLPILSMA